jgi:hypothetical protein
MLGKQLQQHACSAATAAAGRCLQAVEALLLLPALALTQAAGSDQQAVRRLQLVL